MSESTFPIEFIGASRDGQAIETALDPDYCHVTVNERMKEVYVRQNNEPPLDRACWERDVEMTDWKPSLLIEWL